MRNSLPLHMFLGLALVLGLWSPARASQTQEASLPGVQEKSDLVAMHTPDKDGWVQADAGVRPAYVGIQGGTARVSLMRASNGMLFAFTGETGNDFAHIVRGHDGNGSTKESQPAQGAAAPVSDTQPTVTTEATPAAQPVKNETPAPDKAPVAVSPAPSTVTIHAPAVQTVQTAQADAPKEAQAAATPADQKAESSGQVVAQAPAPAAEAPQNDAAEQPKAAKNSLDALVSDLPKNGNDKVIFATAGLAERLSANPGELAPFGLSAADKEYNLPLEKTSSKAEHQAKPRPLRLRDYRAALQIQS